MMNYHRLIDVAQYLKKIHLVNLFPDSQLLGNHFKLNSLLINSSLSN